MDKSVLGLLGGVSALALLSGSASASTAVSIGGPEAGLRPAQSYAELLDPIPNAASLLQAEAQAPGAGESAQLETAQLVYPRYHHHHHHHHNYAYWYWRHRYYHHHHHHHHHHAPGIVIPVP